MYPSSFNAWILTVFSCWVLLSFSSLSFSISWTNLLWDSVNLDLEAPPLLYKLNAVNIILSNINCLVSLNLNSLGLVNPVFLERYANIYLISCTFSSDWSTWYKYKNV